MNRLPKLSLRGRGEGVPANSLPASAQRHIGTILSSQPEAAAWLALLEAVLREGQNPRWDDLASATVLPAERVPDAPLLTGARISLGREPLPPAPLPVRGRGEHDDGAASRGAYLNTEPHPGRDTRHVTESLSSDARERGWGEGRTAETEFPLQAALHDWVSHLLLLASQAGPEAIPLARAAQSPTLDARGMVEAAINADDARLERLADELGVDIEPLAAVADLAALPLLQALRRRFAPAVSTHWHEGYCPICGDWPRLAEIRGLERARCLRCARCGGDWQQPGVRCAFCDATGQGSRATLLSEQDGEARKVETCTRCRGYLKIISTLRAWPGDEVCLADLATIDLDLAALERDYARPEPRGGLAVRIG
ncbi:MAG: formate dehydrogenase accessory protein FdhE [Thermomicrobiales bacterium]